MDTEFKIDYGLLMKYRDELFRPWSNMPPFLTPIFFDKEVLIKYFYDMRISCQFHSETYGSIFFESYGFPFGINPNMKVIAWLGDLEKLPEKEQKYLLSYNTDSDGQLESEFFDAQIQVKYANPIIEVDLILLKTKISEAFRSKYSFDLFTNIKPNVIEIVQNCSKYKRIIFNNVDDLKRFVSEWNEILNEDLNQSEIKSYLRNESVTFEKEIGSLKALEIFLINILGDQTNMIAPLFYLYDLRIWADHKDSQSKYDGVLQNLNLPVNASYAEVYEGLIGKLHFFMVQLLTIVLNDTKK